jgi:hypothetical protein
MESDINMHDVVALLEDVHARHFETGRRLLLRRGQVGTVVTCDSRWSSPERMGAPTLSYRSMPAR